MPAVSHRLGAQVLKGGGVFAHPVHVHPALVGKGAAAHIGHIGREGKVGHLGDVAGGLADADHPVLRDAAVPSLEL